MKGRVTAKQRMDRAWAAAMTDFPNAAAQRHLLVPVPGGVSPATGYPFKVAICCSFCQSVDVRRDAFAEWDQFEQVWILGAVFDQGYCETCDGEARLVERMVDEHDEDIGPLRDSDTFAGEVS